jgi:hypothetical protein
MTKLPGEIGTSFMPMEFVIVSAARRGLRTKRKRSWRMCAYVNALYASLLSFIF